MKIEMSKKSNGTLEKIKSERFNIPFNAEYGPKFYIQENGEKKYACLSQKDEKFVGELDGIGFELYYVEKDDLIEIRTKAENKSGLDFAPESMGLSLGIDTYMSDYPEWNEKFFPTMLRCEKTHIWGYFMSPIGNIAAFASESAVASYSLEYNIVYDKNVKNRKMFGHRIYTANIAFINELPLPERHPQNLTEIKKDEIIENVVYIIPLTSVDEVEKKLAKTLGLPMISADKYTLEKGEKIYATSDGDFEILSPSGKKINNGDVLEEYGLYKATATKNGKIAEASFFCRKPWEWYLKCAASEALEKPQKATTHTESWYGFFSAFLAAKHYPDAKRDKAAEELFDEIMPYMYDFDKAEAIVIPERVQNVAQLVGVLVDKYESNPKKNIKDLEVASRFGDFLIGMQTEDGAYRNRGVHYTCVIYIAKAVLELFLAENRVDEFKEKAKVHYASAKRAIDDLVLHLEDIGTEGEHTLEDGMIACSALQIGMLALMLPESEREKYIKAAEHMINTHACLEQQVIPDCRMNGGSLRFWEAQYDVMLMSNTMNSPHGWTAWTMYATYYLYMLTGKEKYLRQTMNAMGSCAQLISLDGKLRWAFVADPCTKAQRLVPDTEKPSEDGYKSVIATSKAYRGKYETQVVGEQYIDMVSGWYRMGEQKVCGGYNICPLILENSAEDVDNQGGACDNDVHEIFKFMEEAVLEKAFILEREDGSLLTYGCRAERKDDKILLTLNEKTKYIHTNMKKACTVITQDTEINVPKGLKITVL